MDDWKRKASYANAGPASPQQVDVHKLVNQVGKLKITRKLPKGNDRELLTLNFHDTSVEVMAEKGLVPVSALKPLARANGFPQQALRAQ